MALIFSQIRSLKKCVFEQFKRLARQAVDTEPTTTQALDDKSASAAFRFSEI